MFFCLPSPSFLLRLAKQERWCLLGWVLPRVALGEQGVPGQRARAPQPPPASAQRAQSSCCCHSLHSQLCPHGPVLGTGRARDPACVSIAAFHQAKKCHFGVTVSAQTALLEKHFCKIASFQQPNTPLLQIWKQNFKVIKEF